MEDSNFPTHVLISWTLDFDAIVLEQITGMKIQSDLRSCEENLWCLRPAQLDGKSKNEIQNFEKIFMCLWCLDILKTLKTMFILT